MENTLGQYCINVSDIDRAVEFWEGVFERLVKTAAWKKYLDDNQVEDSFMKSTQLATEAEEFIAQRRQIYKEAGITMYR